MGLRSSMTLCLLQTGGLLCYIQCKYWQDGTAEASLKSTPLCDVRPTNDGQSIVDGRNVLCGKSCTWDGWLLNHSCRGICSTSHPFPVARCLLLVCCWNSFSNCHSMRLACSIRLCLLLRSMQSVAASFHMI
jgi:hypothetical protein